MTTVSLKSHTMMRRFRRKMKKSSAEPARHVGKQGGGEAPGEAVEKGKERKIRRGKRSESNSFHPARQIVLCALEPGTPQRVSLFS